MKQQEMSPNFKKKRIGTIYIQSTAAALKSAANHEEQQVKKLTSFIFCALTFWTEDKLVKYK